MHARRQGRFIHAQGKTAGGTAFEILWDISQNCNSGCSTGNQLYELDPRRGRGAYDFRRGRTGWVEASEVAVTLAVLKVKDLTSGKGGRKWGTLLKPFTTGGT